MLIDSPYMGQWRKLGYRYEGQGSQIHDDSVATEFGLESGPVGGSYSLGATMPALVQAFGKQWFEGGWLHVKLVAPVYTSDDVRESAIPDDDGETLELRVEARDGRLCVIGEAGLGDRAPWDAGADGRRGADVAFPDRELGLQFPDHRFNVTAEQLARGPQDVPWFSGQSPWGGPIVQPATIFGVGLQAAGGVEAAPEDAVLGGAGMWAEFWIVLDRVMFPNRDYVMSTHVADKGVSGRTWFTTDEFAVVDSDGNRCARGRQKVKFFVKT